MNKFLATYRLQLTRDFTFADVENLLPHLKSLNISHLYLSPIMESTPGSIHGYDGLDFAEISGERGGKAGFRKLCETLKSGYPSLKIILDIVPNHMAADPLNPYWWDVLLNGPESDYANLFDLRPDPDGKIHLPVLGKDISSLIETGEITVTSSSAHYGERDFPLRPHPEGDLAQALDVQHYKFSHWRESFSLMTYRRFFDVTGLVGVRVEAEENYRLMHTPMLDIIRDSGVVDGVRVDHVDGLSDPAGYLNRLAQDIDHIWVEKIISNGEEIPKWPIKGTTGYEFIDHLNRLFMTPENRAAVIRDWRAFTRSPWEDFATCVWDSKKFVLEYLFPAELSRLVTLSGGDSDQSAIFWSGITTGLPAYRTYIVDAVSEQDKDMIMKGCETAALHMGPDFETARQRFLPLLLNPDTDLRKQIIREWQQLTGPVMAKGLEDTAHYRFTPLAAMNEVGCGVDTKDVKPDDFFLFLNTIAQHSPDTLKATSTHDTKRSEDVRCRLYALSDRPDEWASFRQAASALAIRNSAISPSTEDFLFQALLGTWPLDNQPDQDYQDRIQAYMLKAQREAKLHTSWIEPDENYEKILHDYIGEIFQNEKFVDDLIRFARPLSWAGAIHSLSVQTLKILSPGVADFYQGAGQWDFSLVDPDNRRPVTYQNDPSQNTPLRTLLENWKDGAIKHWLIKTLLQIRADIPNEEQIFPVSVQGRNMDQLICYRIKDVIVLCVRGAGALSQHANPDLLSIPPSLWNDTRIVLPESGAYRNLLTQQQISGNSIPVGILLQKFPVAVIKKE